MQTSAEVFTCVDPSPQSPGGLGGSLVCISDGQLLGCTLSTMPKTVPRKIPVPGRPQKIIYSEFLKRLVVGYEKVDLEVDALTAKRFIRPSIDFIDPDAQDSSSTSSSHFNFDHDNPTQSSGNPSVSSNPTGASGEIIKTILDWNLTSGQKDYHMIVVGTKMPLAELGGRLIYITARPSAEHPGKFDSTVKYVHSYKHPIRAIAPLGKSSLVLGVGDEIVVQTLDESTKKWHRLPGYKMESPPVSVSVKGSYIHVLTSRNSLCILKIDGEKITLHGQDGADREGISHISVDTEPGIIMASSEGGTILGLNETGIIPGEKLIKPAFEAHTPLPVRKLNGSFQPTTPRGSPTKGVAYGTTTNGTVYRFTVLGSNEWHLLRLIQNMCMKNPYLCPFIRKRKSMLDEFDFSPSKPSSYHLDGDILSRVTEQGVSCLRSLIGADKAAPPGSADSQRVQKFVEFAVAVVGETEDPFAAVIEWMDDRLRISN